MKSMKLTLGILLVLSLFLPAALTAADTKGTLTCVALYSETSDGNVSYRVAKGDWVVIKVGDVVPAAAEVRINVDRDWIELIPNAETRNYVQRVIENLAIYRAQRGDNAAHPLAQWLH